MTVQSHQKTIVDGMSDEEVRMFLEAARAGVACGLASPYEWYKNYLYHAPIPYNSGNGVALKMRRAFANFFRSAASHEKEAEDLANMEDHKVIEYFGVW